MLYVPTLAYDRAQKVAVQAWQVASSSPTGGGRLDDGADISRPGYQAQGWYIAPARSTVMAALLANGPYPGIERGRAMQSVDRAQFQVPWWYRTTFVTKGTGRTAVRLDGVIPKADLWVNGYQVARAEELAGAFTVSRFDITDLVTSGTNALALRVHPGSPQEELAISWVDWNQWPPDNNMGPWRDVVIERTGDVVLSPPAVTSELSLPGLQQADLQVSVDVTNLSDREVEVTLAGLVSGGPTAVPLRRDLTLAPHGRETVIFNPAGTSGLRIFSPRVWWPVGEGDHPLYDLELSASADGLVSDQRSVSFGIRSVSSYVAEGDGRRFVVNGRELQLIGGGWAPDLFLRYDYDRLVTEIGYTLDMGLNTVRLEGKFENEEFFELTDAAGLMVMPGWECCSKWEVEKRDGKAWSEHDYAVAERQAVSEAVLLRNHPSVICFLIGSDFAPTPRAATLYTDALQAKGWDLPIVSSATVEGTEAAGPSGMKMTGPYAYVPPAYWYSTAPERGGAIGFNSETSAGNTIPRLDNLRRMLDQDEMEDLWQHPEAKQYHAGPPSVFDNLALFHSALVGRYGAVKSIDDFSRKAQLANYEVTRAQFEAYLSRGFTSKPATGVIYWMLNSAWPSLNWQLYDWYLDTAGAYFGARKANQPLHAFYAYDTGTVGLLNRGPDDAGPVRVSLELRTVDGRLLRTDQWAWERAPARSAVTVAQAPVPDDGGPTYFLALYTDLPDGTTDRNVYWLSTVTDVLDWENSQWYYTPLKRPADLSGLQELPQVEVSVAPELGPVSSGRRTVRVTLRHSRAGAAPALGVHLTMVNVTGTGPEEVVPVIPTTWSDNDLTLFAGQEVQLTATFPAAPGSGQAVQVEGFNLAPALALPV